MIDEFDQLLTKLLDRSFCVKLVNIITSNNDFKIEEETENYIAIHDSLNGRTTYCNFLDLLEVDSLLHFDDISRIQKDIILEFAQKLDKALFIAVKQVFVLESRTTLEDYCRNISDLNEIKCITQYVGTFRQNGDVIINLYNFKKRYGNIGDKYYNYQFVKVLAHELRHSMQYSPMFWILDEINTLLSSVELLEADADRYATKIVQRIKIYDSQL